VRGIRIVQIAHYAITDAQHIGAYHLGADASPSCVNLLLTADWLEIYHRIYLTRLVAGRIIRLSDYPLIQISQIIPLFQPRALKDDSRVQIYEQAFGRTTRSRRKYTMRIK
jgi:hypothetical protein